ncbi:MAG: serine/threonine-protein kinase, partial [Gemmatimonadota bacterium]
LGEGGMGQVYLAEHVKMGRMSAIKVMTQALANDMDAVGRFNREAANASKISHPNIAAIYDFGETSDGLIYLAMEFVEGESLTKLCEALGALPAPRAAEIARQVASALEAAHERGIVHRDLKPDNIMISRGRDGADLVKVVDFGIAKAAEGAGQKVTRTGLVVGTPEYMSPEQLTGDTLDGRSDLYALGLVTFNMLTGMLPFTGQTTQEALLKRLTDRPLSLAEARTDLVWPPALQAVIDRALSRLASDRYQHASEFGEAIVAAVRGMSADEVENARTLVIPGATPRAASSATAAPTMPAPAAPVVPAPASARDRLLVPAVLAAALVVAVGGAMFMRSRANGASVTAASAPHVDSAASSVGATLPPSASADSSNAKPDSDNAAATSGASGVKSDSIVTAIAPAPAPVPPEPAAAPAPIVTPTTHGAGARPPRTRTMPTRPAGTTSPSAAPTAPPASPVAAPTQPPSTSPPTNAEQARARIEAAGRMVDEGKPAEAMTAVRGAMPLLPTRDDSVTALYYLSRAMIKRAGTTGDEASRTRACSILTLITKATSHPKAGEIRSFSAQECK